MPKQSLVEFTRCPYDASPIEAETYSGGSALLSCSTCGAAWEWHNAWLRRVREPDREAVRRARAGNAASHDRSGHSDHSDHSGHS
jgi:hypothetical protein